MLIPSSLPLAQCALFSAPFHQPRQHGHRPSSAAAGLCPLRAARALPVASVEPLCGLRCRRSSRRPRAGTCDPAVRAYFSTGSACSIRRYSRRMRHPSGVKRWPTRTSFVSPLLAVIIPIGSGRATSSSPSNFGTMEKRRAAAAAPTTPASAFFGTLAVEQFPLPLVLEQVVRLQSDVRDRRDGYSPVDVVAGQPQPEIAPHRRRHLRRACREIALHRFPERENARLWRALECGSMFHSHPLEKPTCRRF